MINICFGINDAYCQHCGVTIASILYNSNPEDDYTIYIITDYLSEENRQHLNNLKLIREFNLEILIVSNEDYEDLNIGNNLGPSAFFRFKAFDLIKTDKVLYLDCDLVVRKDIAELYNTKIEDGYYCIGIEDIIAPQMKKKLELSPTTLYINSGVMLINLDYCRKCNVYEMICDFIDSPWERKWQDQEIVNHLFQDKIQGVDIKWNCMYGYVNYYEDRQHYEENAKDPAIVHYITHRKPWVPGEFCHLKSDYFKYLRITSWFQDFMFEYRIREMDIMFRQIDDLSCKIDRLEQSINEISVK
jgi:lipopolysaccharide biosynthesis glycosyltransferase